MTKYDRQDISEEPAVSLEGVLSEAEVQELFGVTRDQLSELRLKKALPFVRINQKARVYLATDIMGWLYTQRVVLNSGSETEEVE